MGRETIVEISGNRYRYAYDPERQATIYKGPVGEAPPIGEEEFLVWATSQEMPEIQVDDLTGDAKKYAQMIIASRGPNKGRVRASKPKVDRNKPGTGNAAYIWRMVAFGASPNPRHHHLPILADFDIEAKDHDERRKTMKELDVIVEQIMATIPLQKQYGTLRWGHAMGYFKEE